MESGALNGLTFSTSYMFEAFANWTAIHVEADPENYFNLRGNREEAVNVHAALCSESKLLHYSSYGVIPVRGFVEFMTPSFIKKWHGPIHNGKVKIEDLPTTQCVPVKKLLREMNVRHIDVWILDTEGAEESVLQGTDFNEVHFNSVAMECDTHDVEKNNRKMAILESNNFKCKLIERNCMCKHNDFLARSAPDRSTLKMWDGNKWGKQYKQAAWAD
jgi:FkbM family methyltransferase